MEIIKNKYQVICKSSDSQGDFEFRIHNDGTQIQLETAINNFSSDTYADVNRADLEQIVEAISSVLGVGNVLEKAKKWNELDQKISQYYETYENGELIHDNALPEIGEVAASAFGYL